MKKSKPNNNAGKGDKPRNCYSEEFKENFRKIDWSKKKFVLVDQSKVYLYPDHLNELVQCLLNDKGVRPEDYLVTDESTVGDFLMGEKLSKGLGKLEKKYRLSPLTGDDFIWKVIEKMHSFRAF